jgi:hypothetical protein
MKKYKKYAVQSIVPQPVQTGPTPTPDLPPGLPSSLIAGSRAHRRKVCMHAVLMHCKVSYDQLREVDITPPKFGLPSLQTGIATRSPQASRCAIIRHGMASKP